MTTIKVVSFPLIKQGKPTPYTQRPSAKPGPAATVDVNFTNNYEARVLMDTKR